MPRCATNEKLDRVKWAYNVPYSAILFTVQIISSAHPQGQPNDCKYECPTDGYVPVCASDGNETWTFTNECIMEYFNCVDSKDFRIMKRGECISVESKDVPPSKEELACPTCTKTYDPVCGCDDRETKTFTNKCTMESINCRESREFRLISLGPCACECKDDAVSTAAPLKRCQICTKHYRPICGSDGNETRTFPNKCVMDRINRHECREFEQIMNGSCVFENYAINTKSTLQQQRSCFACTKEYIPICGSDGTETKTFPNKCAMDRINRHECREFQKIRDGHCNGKEASATHSQTDV